MDYFNHYKKLINKARNRRLDEHCVESHHVWPKCLGGPDENWNMVELTPEEHYVAHQLLVKLFPEENGLVWAACQMTRGKHGNRKSNKLYGWLKRRHMKIAKARKGSNNPSYGNYWYHNPNTLEYGKFKPEEAPDGWERGKTPCGRCTECGAPTGKRARDKRYCEEHAKQRLEEHWRQTRENKVQTAEDLFEMYKRSNCQSVTEFAKSVGTTQPRLTQLWKKHIPEYRDAQHGKSFKPG